MTTQLGMDPGMLTEEIEFLEKREAPDGQGGRASQWVPIHEGFAWARIRRLSASKRTMAMQASAPTTYEVTCRFREGITAEHRLQWRSRNNVTLQVTSEPLNLDERSDYIVFSAVEAKD